MRAGYVHEAVVRMDEGADARAPGAAVTVALCGHWEHEPPCRWPHHTGISGPASNLGLRILFACSAADESDVRARIEDALRSGTLPEPRASWSVVDSGAGEVDDDEREHVGRLLAS